MDYRKITSRSSLQYRLQQDATTDENGIRLYQGRYMIALGTYYTPTVGVAVDVELEDGTILNCYVGDIKADKDTDVTNRYQKHDGSVIEFIVDTDKLPSVVKKYGNVAVLPQFQANVKKITVYR
jgi:hypothetical protein